MSKTKKSLVISIFTLVMAVAIATTSTFAWFAMTETPSVEEFELTVTTQDGLFISANHESGYKMDLEALSLQAAKNFDFTRLNAATARLADTYLKDDVSGTLTVVDDLATPSELEIKLADANAKRVEGSDEVIVGDKVSIVKVYGHYDDVTLTKGLFFESLTGNAVAANYSFSDAIVSEPTDWATSYKTNYVERTGSVGDYTYTAITAGSAPTFSEATYCKIVFANLYQFDVFFISSSPYSIFMDGTETVTNVTTKTQSAKTVKSPREVIAADLVGADATLAEAALGANIDAFAANAVRIGVVGTTNTVVYNPNSTKGWSTIASYNMAHEYYNSLASASNQLTAVQKAEAGTVLSVLDTTADGACQLVTLVKTTSGNPLFNYFGDGSDVYEGKVTISIWLEGKDADCFESIYEDIMKINIGFVGVNMQA